MNENEQTSEDIPLIRFAEQAYLDYSMYVIMDRALPHIGDGLKPVQRRIVYAMSELGLAATSKYKKSARTVGDVLGKYHPHGDSACYEAMVLMAQPFSYRYPLVDGQGNWGAQDDPKSFAAMRYTEARLSRYTQCLLAELGQGTVNWQPNFDGTLSEPKILPAQVPNILLNGGMGIAVGMSTDIPPHNLREVVQACVQLLDSPESTLDDICDLLPGPDYPTEAEIITPKEELKFLYANGTGSVRMRARYHAEKGEVVIDALPHQVSGAKILEQIAAQINAKKLPLVDDLRDESDHEHPIRLVVGLRSNRVDADEVMLHLFATTDLEKTYRVNINLIGLDQRPKVVGIIELLQEWLFFRTEVVRKRLQYRYDAVLDRIEVLQGLLIIFLNIDEVIHIIRTEDDPKASLMQRFELTERQVEAILNLRLRRLAKLEEIRLREEMSELSLEKDSLQALLASKARLKTLIKKELLALAKEHGDERRSPIIERPPSRELSQKAVIPADPITIVLSRLGWVRAAKGHDVDVSTLAFKAGDEHLVSTRGRSNQTVFFMDTTGRCYSMPAHKLPSARGHGEPLTNRFTLPKGAVPTGVLVGDIEQECCVLLSSYGYGFVCLLADMVAKNKAGKATLNLAGQAQPLPPIKVVDYETDRLAIATSLGRLLLFPLKDLPIMRKGKGIKGINIPKVDLDGGKEIVTAFCVLPQQAALIVHSGKRHIKIKGPDMENYMGTRGRRGLFLPQGFRRVERLSRVE